MQRVAFYVQSIHCLYMFIFVSNISEIQILPLYKQRPVSCSEMLPNPELDDEPNNSINFYTNNHMSQLKGKGLSLQY